MNIGEVANPSLLRFAQQVEVGLVIDMLIINSVCLACNAKAGNSQINASHNALQGCGVGCLCLDQLICTNRSGATRVPNKRNHIPPAALVLLTQKAPQIACRTSDEDTFHGLFPSHLTGLAPARMDTRTLRTYGAVKEPGFQQADVPQQVI
jgi:hypothetical protein